jgi:hypothetical protein
MTDMKSGLKILIGIALVAGTVSLAACGGPDRESRTTTEQSSTSMPMAQPMSTTTTTSTEHSNP